MADETFWGSLLGRVVAAANATFTYEELVLQISPLSLVLALSPFFLRHYSKSPVYLRHIPFPRLKLVSTVPLISLFVSQASANLFFFSVRHRFSHMP